MIYRSRTNSLKTIKVDCRLLTVVSLSLCLVSSSVTPAFAVEEGKAATAGSLSLPDKPADNNTNTAPSESVPPPTSSTIQSGPTESTPKASGSAQSGTETAKEKKTKSRTRSTRSSRSRSKETTPATNSDTTVKPESDTKSDTKPLESTNPENLKPSDSQATDIVPKSGSTTPATEASGTTSPTSTTSSPATGPTPDTTSSTTSETVPKKKTGRSREKRPPSPATTENPDATPKTSKRKSRSKSKPEDAGSTTSGAQPVSPSPEKTTEDLPSQPTGKTPVKVETPSTDKAPSDPLPTTEPQTTQEPPTDTNADDKANDIPAPTEVKPESTTTKKDDDSESAENDEITPPKKKPKRPQSLAEADEFLLKNKFEAAEDAYRGLVAEDETGDAYAGLAVSLAKQNWPKKILEAEKIMKKGREQFADNPNMMAAGGFVSYVHSKSVASPARRDRFLEAAESLSKRAVKLSPDTVIAQQTLGLVKLAQDDPEGAIPPLKQAAKMAGDPYSNTLLAEALLKVDPHDADAKSLIDEALSTDSKYNPALLQKAIYLTNKGKHEEAYTELHTIPKDQRGSEWHKVQGDIYKTQGDGPSALASWKEANRLDPRNPEPYKDLAHYYAARGDGELAIAEMHNALEILPNDLRLRGDLAELALRQDKLDVAETEYRTILAVKDLDPASLLGLSRVFFRKARKEGQYPTGYSELMDKLQNVVTEQSVQGQLVRKGAKNLAEKIQLSEAEKALADSPPRFREARQLFSQVIGSHREDPYELLSLGDQAYNDGDLKAAEEAFGYAKEIPEIAPRAEQGISKIVSQRNEAKRHTQLGNATWKLPEVAIDHYRQALIADPQSPDAYYGLYKLYYRLKKDDQKAIDYAHNFLEASEDTDPLRKEVEDDLSKMKKRVHKENTK